MCMLPWNVLSQSFAHEGVMHHLSGTCCETTSCMSNKLVSMSPVRCSFLEGAPSVMTQLCLSQYKLHHNTACVPAECIPIRVAFQYRWRASFEHTSEPTTYVAAALRLRSVSGLPGCQQEHGLITHASLSQCCRVSCRSCMGPCRAHPQQVQLPQTAACR